MNVNNGIRLDRYLNINDISRSRNMAKEEIVNGYIFVNDKIIKKPSHLVFDKDIVSKKEEFCDYVSRGGLKLEKAIKYFQIDITNKICMDIGASTGGFTDCMLKNKAKKVYAIDVGKDQLNEKLRNNKNIISLEQINARDYNFDLIKDKIDFITIDVSFISLKKILSNIFRYYKSDMLLLIKPQFEVGSKYIGKKGVVKNKEKIKEVLNFYKNYFNENSYKTKGIIQSPIKGQKGNVEYLVFIQYSK